MYEVIHYFTDLQDNEFPYNPGDVFPREGVEVSEERLAELSGSNNKQHKPLIKKVEEADDNTVDEQYEPLPFPDDERKYTNSEINRMSTTDLQNLAASIGIEGAFDMTGADLKKRLISDMGL